LDSFNKKQKNRSFYYSLAFICLFFLIALFAPFIAPYDPLLIDLDHIKESPNSSHLLGTDTVGRDVLSRIIYGTRISLFVGVSATLLSLGFGLMIGLISGYYGGKTDMFFTMIIDLFLAFPSLLLAIGISVVLPPGLLSVTFVLCIVGWASFARLFRGMVLSFKENTFVDSARAIGCSNMRIMFIHILPHCLPVSLIAASLKVGSFILSESALSFLGLGVQPPTPTWGAMVSLNRGYLPSAPWMILFPGLAIALAVIVFNSFGDASRDMMGQDIKI